jgi:hypothetical protein
LNALSRDNDIAKPYEDSFARLDGRDRSALEYKLQGWGKWWEENSEFEGHAPMSAINAFLEGFGGGIYGDRQLCKDMPKEVYDMHQRFLSLSDNEREVIWNHYVAAVNPATGRCPTDQEKAWLLGLTYANYRVRLCRAKFRIHGIEPNEMLGTSAPPRELTQAEGDAALGEWRRSDKAHQACAKLAKKFGVTWAAMRRAISQAAKREKPKQKD